MKSPISVDDIIVELISRMGSKRFGLSSDYIAKFIFKLLAYYYKKGLTGLPPYPAILNMLYKEQVLVAFDNRGILLGHLMFWVYPDYVKFGGLAVIEDAKGTGVSGKLLEYGKHIVKNQYGGRPCISYIKESNDVAIEFFKKQGFEIIKDWAKDKRERKLSKKEIEFTRKAIFYFKKPKTVFDFVK